MAWTPPPSRPDRVLVWSSQLAANDFPPVCAMTGAPAETWRKFRFSTAPAWAAVFLILLCTGFGLLIVFVAMYLVSRRASGYLPLTRASSRRVALASWVPAGLIVGALVLGFVALVVWGSTSSSSTRVSSSLVYTKWVADANIISGPEVGYKPSMIGLGGNDVASVTASNDASSGGWTVNITFTSRGRDLFATFTRDNVAACPGDPASDAKATCPERHLTMWLGLTQADIDRWDDVAVNSAVSKPWGSGGKLLADLLTLQEIDGGDVAISGNFTQTDAQDLVAAIQPTSTTSSPVGSTTAAVLGGLAFITIVAAVIGGIVIRRLVGPHATVMEQRPGQTDRLVEIRNVHPAFAAAVQQMHQARAATPSAPLPPGSN